MMRGDLFFHAKNLLMPYNKNIATKAIIVKLARRINHSLNSQASPLYDGERDQVQSVHLPDAGSIALQKSMNFSVQLALAVD
jgi:hypothetical protein